MSLRTFARTSHLAGVTALAGLTACSDLAPNTAPRDLSAGPAALAVAPTPPTARARHESAEIRAFADQEPDFAGFYIDSVGDVQVQLVRDARAEVVLEKVRAMLAREGIDKDARRGGSQRALRRRAAQFSFAELALWRDSVGDVILSMDGVSSVDLDEVRNRLTFGIERPDVRPTVEQYLRAAGIPVGAAAFVHETVGRLVIDTTRNLNSRIRPLAGGTNFRSFASNGSTAGPGGQCSLGVGGYKGGTPVMFTASHCTYAENSLDYGKIRQPETYGSDPALAAFGQEIYDNSTYRGGTLFDREDCRQADVAAFDVSSVPAFPGETGFLAGRIAFPDMLRRGTSVRTLFVNGVGYIDSVNVGPYYLRSDMPFMHVVSMQTHPVAGQQVFKVGYTTGLTYGYVYATCRDHKINNPPTGHTTNHICMDDADLGAHPGDSGGPVFAMAPGADGSAAIFFGIMVAQESSRTGGSSFASVRQINQEIGTNWTVVGP